MRARSGAAVSVVCTATVTAARLLHRSRGWWVRWRRGDRAGLPGGRDQVDVMVKPEPLFAYTVEEPA
jgi:hypothetical protein